MTSCMISKRQLHGRLLSLLIGKYSSFHCEDISFHIELSSAFQADSLLRSPCSGLVLDGKAPQPPRGSHTARSRHIHLGFTLKHHPLCLISAMGKNLQRPWRAVKS